MGKTTKNAAKTAVKIEDMAPARDAKGGNVVQDLTSKVLQMANDTKKAIIANLRA